MAIRPGSPVYDGSARLPPAIPKRCPLRRSCAARRRRAAGVQDRENRDPLCHHSSRGSTSAPDGRIQAGDARARLRRSDRPNLWESVAAGRSLRAVSDRSPRFLPTGQTTFCSMHRPPARRAISVPPPSKSNGQECADPATRDLRALLTPVGDSSGSRPSSKTGRQAIALNQRLALSGMP